MRLGFVFVSACINKLNEVFNIETSYIFLLKMVELHVFIEKKLEDTMLN